MREPREYESPLCAQSGGDFWFPETGQGTTAETVCARSICNQCSHKVECAEWGLRKERHGIWGGLTSYDRKIIRKELKISLNEPRWDEGIA